jgi:hypothetical protein
VHVTTGKVPVVVVKDDSDKLHSVYESKCDFASPVLVTWQPRIADAGLSCHMLLRPA